MRRRPAAILPALGAVLALGSLAACGGSGGASPASTPSAPRTSPAATAAAAPVKAATAAGTAACTSITKTVNDAYSNAQQRAQAKHAQFPAISVTDLTGAYLAGILKNDAQAIAAEEVAAGVTPGLRAAEERLVVAAQGLYQNYGQVAADAKYGGEAQAAVNAINKACS